MSIMLIMGLLCGHFYVEVHLFLYPVGLVFIMNGYWILTKACNVPIKIQMQKFSAKVWPNSTANLKGYTPLTSWSTPVMEGWHNLFVMYNIYKIYINYVYIYINQ